MSIPDDWTADDSLAITALAKAKAHLYADVILPSGRVLDADEGNTLIARYATENDNTGREASP